MKLFCINLVFLVCSIFSTHTAIAQKRAKTDTLKKRPTVALVLSGGGAKGFAEIGTLEVIDELGIPIDYIVGTSMGSAMGAFYAIGYTGKEIAKEVAKQDWSTAFTDKIVSRKTPISRKEELSRYALSFPIRGGIHLPKGIVRGQEIMNILSKYTVGYQDSLNFKKFPIPYSCVVTDLETGESIVLESGNLTQAIRASMSIPSVFTPTEIGERVFIDGGVVNNFPTDIAKIEGYDFIIGVDVQTPLLHKKDLVSAKDIAYQLLGFLGKKRNDDNIKLTDVYIHPNISKYTTSSFAPAEVDSLIEIGRKAARKAYPQLVKLKEKLGKNVSKEKHTTPNFNAPLFFNHIKVGGLKKISQKLFMQKIDLKDINSITTTDLKNKIDDVSASLDLDLLTYQLSQDTLRFIAHERNQNRFNVGLHYDSDNNASILLNTTWNNLLFKHSRASFDAI
ncbi:MAG: patatin-like phospholipase family protein, partial [Flavobacteriaceae bacterium]|nr:patatin-like phospholipase family protein [Flavobacteriaceae bacterium]